MLQTPEQLRALIHPLVTSMHLKKDFSKKEYPEDVLVIKTCFPNAGDNYEAFDSYLLDLLLDLKSLKNWAENCIGPFDRIDIRTT